MGLYDFKPQFVPFILSGEKKHTIREMRKYPDKPGKTLYLYVGLRTKKAKLIKRVKCVKVERITIEKSGKNWPVFSVRIAGFLLSPSECEQLAHHDGFSNFDQMMKFWDGRLPFKGQIVHWA